MDLDEWLDDVLRKPNDQLRHVRDGMRTAVTEAFIRRFSLELGEMAKAARGLESYGDHALPADGEYAVPTEVRAARIAMTTFLDHLDPAWRERFPT